MTLLTAHKIMVATAILFLIGFAVREAMLVARAGGAVDLGLGATAAVGAAALAIYLRWLLRSKGKALEAAAKRRSSRRDN
jgi:hypothetical protein